jgi:uncharacterized protein (TIGR00297 family)
MQLLIGLLLAILIALLAWRARALSTSGALAAILTGGLIFGLGGLSWAALLLVFFISSTALSKGFARRKAALNEKFSKGSRRDAGQVLANGGLGALLVVASALLGAPPWIWLAYVGAMAAVNADTWATELGVLNARPPRLITTGKPAERGTSGAISLLGTLAALSGAALVGLVAVLLPPPGFREWVTSGSVVLLAATLGGLAGSLFDSLLGATVQAIYYCPACLKETERHPQHLCGSTTQPLRGWQWLNNDGVNFLCSLAGALLAAALWALLA